MYCYTITCCCLGEEHIQVIKSSAKFHRASWMTCVASLKLQFTSRSMVLISEQMYGTSGIHVSTKNRNPFCLQEQLSYFWIKSPQVDKNHQILLEIRASETCWVSSSRWPWPCIQLDPSKICLAKGMRLAAFPHSLLRAVLGGSSQDL